MGAIFKNPPGSGFFASQGHFSSKTSTDLARGGELVSGPTTMFLQPKTHLLQTLIAKKCEIKKQNLSKHLKTLRAIENS